MKWLADHELDSTPGAGDGLGLPMWKRWAFEQNLIASRGGGYVVWMWDKQTKMFHFRQVYREN